MLRKIGYILLSSLLIITTVGFVISRHYCSDNLVSVSINLQNASCCNDLESECCHNDYTLVILKVVFTQPDVTETSISEID